jgi:hypothetical protein
MLERVTQISRGSPTGRYATFESPTTAGVRRFGHKHTSLTLPITLCYKVLTMIEDPKKPNQPNSGDARFMLHEIERLQGQTRSVLKSSWFPLLVFGVLNVCAAAIPQGPALGIYWSIAGISGAIATSVYYSRRERTTGVQGPFLPYIATSAGIFIGCFAAGAVGGTFDLDRLAALGPGAVVAAGVVVFGILDHNKVLAGVGVVLGVLVAGLWMSSVSPSGAAVILALTVGTIFIVTGLLFYFSERAHS